MTSPASQNDIAVTPSRSRQPSHVLIEPHLRHSIFVDDDPSSVNAEGHEGDKLAELFFSGTHGVSPPPRLHSYAEPSAKSLPTEQSYASHDFKALFVVVEDIGSGEHHHPHIHYVFSDDDPELLTNAVLHNLDQSLVIEQSSEMLPEGGSAVKDRVLILDLDESGRNVTAVQSLSQEWQIGNTTLSAAPTFANGVQEENNSLMLTIQGREQHRFHADTASSQIITEANNHNDDALVGALNTLAMTFQAEQVALQKLVDEFR